MSDYFENIDEEIIDDIDEENTAAECMETEEEIDYYPPSGYEGFLDEDKFYMSMHQKELIRRSCTMFYDMQKVRIQTGNRICMSFYKQAGLEPGMSKEKLDKEMKKALDLIVKEYDRLADAFADHKAYLKRAIKEGKFDYVDKKTQQISSIKLEYIQNYYDFELISVYKNIHKQEDVLKKILEHNLEGIPIWDEYLKNVQGIGPAMGGVIIGYFDIYKAKYVSSFIKYAGLDTVYDPEKGKRVGRTMHYTVMREYVDSEGKTKMKKSITFNPFVKTKLVGVLPGVFLKTNSDYMTAFYDYKNRIENRGGDYTKGHIYKMANRYMVCQFLKDLFVNWKRIEGLPCPKSYEEEYLGKAPHHFPPLEEYKKNHPEMFEKKSKKVG